MTVQELRDVNRLTVGAKHLHDYAALQCGQCRWQFTADLARYHCPDDGQMFACPHCDTTSVGILFGVQTERLPLAQRRPLRIPA